MTDLNIPEKLVKMVKLTLGSTILKIFIEGESTTCKTLQ